MDIFMKFREFVKESEDVMFEKKHINNNGIFPVKYMLYVVKIPNDEEFLIKEKLLFNQWFIMDSKEYRIEENLWIYGCNPKKERKTIVDVIKTLIKGLKNEKITKEIIVCHNKLIIYNEEDFDMIICKCIKDAQRLHHLLYKIATKNKIKGLLFSGTANPVNISLLYEIIHEETGWPLTKIRRTTTRP